MNQPKTHQITGVGPIEVDGTYKVFTVLPTPFIVTAETAKRWGIHPAIGDNVIEDHEGILTLEVCAHHQGVDEEPAEKKTDGSAGYSAPSGPPNRYRANFEVDAYAINAVDGEYQPDGSLFLVLETGEKYVASGAMLEQHVPQVGDYLVRFSSVEEMELLFPKAEFEANYKPVEA